MKKFILSLFVGFIGIISFCSADKVENLIEIVKSDSVSVTPSNSAMLLNLRPADYGIYCIDVSNYDAGGNLYTFLMFGRFEYPSQTPSAGNYLNIYDSLSLYCIDVNQPYIGVKNTTQYTISFDYDLYSLSDLLQTDIPVLSSLECQTEYNLIPISEVDTNYCVGNGLCPSEMGSGDLQYSNLYINDILHPGKQNIFVNIPDYITWDYSVGDDDFNLYVGSGYDVDYINSVIDINSYRPTSEDFTNVFVSGLTLVMPYIVIVLFIVFIRKLIKRIFK